MLCSKYGQNHNRFHYNVLSADGDYVKWQENPVWFVFSQYELALENVICIHMTKQA